MYYPGIAVGLFRIGLTPFQRWGFSNRCFLIKNFQKNPTRQPWLKMIFLKFNAISAIASKD